VIVTAVLLLHRQAKIIDRAKKGLFANAQIRAKNFFREFAAV